MQASIQALHRLNRPGPFEVQTGLLLACAVEGRQVPAELCLVDELGAIHGEGDKRGDHGRHDEGENQQ